MRHTSGNVLAGNTALDGVVARCAGQPGVHGEHHHVRSGAARLRHGFPHLGHDITNHDAPSEVVAIPHHGARRGGTDDPDVHTTALHHGEAAKGVRAIRATRVRGEKRKLRLRERTLEKRHAVVEFVIAHRRGVVRHRVHRRNHGMRRTRRRNAGGRVGKRIPLEQVAGVQQHHPSGIGGADRVHDGGGARQAAHAVGATAFIVPAPQAPVHVGCTEHNKVEPVTGRLRRGGKRMYRDAKCGGECQETDLHGKNLCGGGAGGELPDVDAPPRRGHTSKARVSPARPLTGP